MSATATMIAQVRRMVAEPTTTTYSDVAIQGYIEKYPLMDERGQQPYTFDSATPPAEVVNPQWIATYDLNAAAADIWEEKAAAVAANFDFSADGTSFHQSQQYEQYLKMARTYRARRCAKTARLFKWPDENTGADRFPWIGNLPEADA